MPKTGIREALLREYEQCMASYRHTYQTIWQAGAFFGAMSAALLAFGAAPGATVVVNADGVEADQVAGQATWLLFSAPIPFLFWYLGVFRPMNGYADLRAERLVAIEARLNEKIKGLEMEHFTSYEVSRRPEPGPWRGLWRLVVRPRVRHVVGLFCALLVVVDGAAIAVHYLA